MNNAEPDPFPKSKMGAVLLGLSPVPILLGEIWLANKDRTGQGLALVILTAIIYAPFISFFAAFRLTRGPQARSPANIIIRLFVDVAFLAVNLTIAAAGCGAVIGPR